MKTKIAIIILLSVLVIIFAVQNTRIVEIELFVWKFHIPRSLLIFTILYIGFSIGRTFEYVRSAISEKKSRSRG